MKKLIAIVLCALLMLSVCAFTEGPSGSHNYSLSGIKVSTADMDIDMSDVNICIDVTDGDPGAVLMHVDYQGETVSQFGFTEVDGLYIVHLDSQSLGHKDYAIDPVKELAKDLDSLRNKLVELLQNADTDAAAQSIMDFFSNMDQAEEPMTDEEIEALQEQIEQAIEEAENSGVNFSGDPTNILEECINDPETVTLEGKTAEYDGEEIVFPDGEYVHHSFTVDNDHMLQLMSMMTVDGKPADFVAQMEESGAEAELNGSFYKGQEDVDAAFGSVSVNVTMPEMDDPLVAGFGFAKVPTDEGTSLTVAIGQAASEDDATSLYFTAVAGESTDAEFGPDSINMDELINLSDMESEEAAELFQQDVAMVLGDALGAIMTPIAEAMPEDAMMVPEDQAVPEE